MKFDVNQLTLEEKLHLLTGKNRWQLSTANGKLPEVWLCDGPHGLRKKLDDNTTLPATTMPTLSVLANTWDTELAYLHGATIADECILNGADVLFAIGVSYTGTLVPAYTGDNKSEIVVAWDMGVSGTDSITITASGAPALAVDFNGHVDDMVYTSIGVHGIRAVLDGNIIKLQVKDDGEWKDAGGGVQHGTASISPDTITVKYDTPTATATLTTNSDGTPTVTSSDENVATASISGTTITITGVSTGTATITVSIPETEKYTACEATIAVTALRGSLSVTAALPYLAGSTVGGIAAGFLGPRIPVKWLHRLLGIFILWGGIRYLCR
jgi:hypothetical protein